ncbi:MAG: hypothetical protein KDJ40_05270, partial [Hyphomicrobiales bacterium]|nr:hypothetical protein [Hyphomicrobiales bacterium]
MLDASGSVSPSGGALSYSWSIVQSPAGSNARLSNSSAVRPTFTVDAAGAYVVRLAVRSSDGEADGDHDLGPASVTQVVVSTTNVPPAARAGVDRFVTVGQTVGLDGAGSFDPDGDKIAYQWTWLARPDGSAAAFSSAGSARPLVSIDKEGRYVAQLRVVDANGAVSEPSVVVLSTHTDIAPISNAGPRQVVAVGAATRIDADGSVMPTGEPLTANWSLLSTPVGSAAALTTASDARQMVTPDMSGDYVAQASAAGASEATYFAQIGASALDDCRRSGVHAEGRTSDEYCYRLWGSRYATTLISTGVVAPVASAGPDQLFDPGATVVLDGGRSTDANGRALTYQWALISTPTGSTARLDDPASVRPSFVADIDGLYVAQLIVSNGQLQSEPSTVVIASPVGPKLVAPVADAGRDNLGTSGKSVALDGSASNAVDGSSPVSRWSNIGLGDQAAGVIGDPASPRTSFQFPAAGTPLMQAVLAGPAILPIGGQETVAEKPSNGRTGVTLASFGLMTASGKTYSIWRVRNYGAQAVQATLDLPSANFATSFSLPGGKEAFIASPNTAKAPPHRLLVGGRVLATVQTSVGMTFSDTRNVDGGNPLKLTILQLAVANGLFVAYDDVVLSTVEARPTAIPSAPATSYLRAPITFDGAQSINPNKPSAPTSGLTYAWTLLSKPATSSATLSATNAAQVSLTPDAYGYYVAQLTVSDGVLQSRAKTVVVRVVNRLPVADLKAASPVAVGQTMQLDGSGSLDPDGWPLVYQWSLLSAPTGSRSALSSASIANPTFKPDVAGAYQFQLVVSDSYGASAPAKATVVAQSAGLVFDALPAQSVELGSALTFNVHATDPSGATVAYAIMSGPLPTGATFNAATGAFYFRPTSNSPASYTIAFSATNGRDVGNLTVPIVITGTPSGATASVTAQIYDAVDYARGVRTPVSGATVSSNGQSASSSSAGMAMLGNLPAGTDTLVISGASAAHSPDGSAYSDAIVSANLIAGVVNRLDSPILLGRASGGTQINDGGTTTVTNPALNVTLTIAPNSAFNADGTPYTGAISIGTLPANTSINLPVGYSPCQILTISPVGVTFNPPAQLTVANSDRLPAGTQVDLWAFDAALSNTRVVGIGQVSSDGASISMLVGGVPGGTALAMAPRRPGLAKVATQPTDVFAPSALGLGDMSASFSPAGVRQLDKARGLTFVYHSSTASPSVVVKENATLPANTGLPRSLQTQLTFAGVAQTTTLSTDLSNALRPGVTLDATANNALVQGGLADVSGLSSGSYAYSFLTLSKFACSTVASQTTGQIVVNNQTRSAFGAGWQLAELQKLTPQPDGSVLITEGSGRALAASPQQAPSFDVPNPVNIPVNGPFLGATADLQNSGLPSLAKLGWKDGTLNIILNKGNRQFAKTSVIPVGDPGTQRPDGTIDVDVADVALGDVTGDGNVDAAYLNSHHNEAKILVGASGGTFLTTPLAVESNGPGGGIVMGDFIGDGYGHLMMSENQSAWPDLHIIYNDGKNNFTFHHDAPILPGNNYMHVKVRLPGFQHDTVAVLTADGSLSFTYGGSTSGNYRDSSWSRGPSNLGYWQIDNDEQVIDSFKLPTPLAPFGPSRVLATGDLDGAGSPSFAVATSQAIHIVKWIAPGANNQQITQTLNLPNGLVPDSVTLAPLAKGNRPSLIVTAKTAGFYVFPNDGRGNFATTPVFIQTPFRVGVEANVVDFDGDGIADIALNDLDNDRVAIFFGKANPGGAFVAPIGDYTRLVKNDDGTYSRVYNDGTVVAFDASGFQTTITDANGNKTSYTYNSAGQLTQIVDPTGATTSFTYSGAWLASVTDSAGRTTLFEHDAAGDLTKVTDPLGAVTQYLYDAAHRLVVTIDANSNRTTQTYTATGQLSVQTYPDGSSVKLDVSRALGLDALGVDLNGPTNAAFVPAEARISLLQDAAGNISETEVNEWGAVVRTVDAVGRESLFARDAANNLVTATLPAGAPAGADTPTAVGTPRVKASDSVVHVYAYDSAGNLVMRNEAAGHGVSPDTWSPVDRTTKYVYEATHGKLVQKTDPNGNVTAWAYDAKGNMTALTDALGGVTAYTYNAQGLPLTRTDAKGNVTAYAYDANGNLTRTTDALGTLFDRYYDAIGNVILTIDAVGTPVERRRSFQYDSNNRKTSETRATGETIRYGYDLVGNLAQTIDPAGNVATATFDGLNRVVSQTMPDSGTSGYAYDSNGNLTAATDASGAVTRYAYDAANRRISSTDPLGATTTSSYDLRNNLSAFTNERGKTTTFVHDVLGRLATRITPTGGAGYRYGYDLNGNLTNSQAPTGEWRGWYVYDALNRLTHDALDNVDYVYDAVGNVTSAANLTYSYDALNRKVSENWAFSTPVAFAYAYDALSRRASYGDSLGATTRYAYDGEDRLTQITTPWGAQIAQSYDPAGRPLRLAFPNGLDADVSFEARTGRLATLQHRAGSLAAPVASFSHAYNAIGDLASQTELTSSKTFAYDSNARLTGVTQTSPAPAAQVESYTYDPAGNRIASHLSAAITVDDGDRTLEDATNTYQWDADGGLVRRVNKANGATIDFLWAYDALRNRKRLNELQGPWPRNFVYGPFGRLAHIGIPFGPYTDLYQDGPDTALMH